ncbi:uncharacterized protein RHIMIDRAFT_295401 [Rhizopus microsporus ATCC 52813]|uniref:Cas12f1-like TNB domain-containing protein n=1 Tax=Rhizopus microsporus ATCC 52813 TaxID=1340429 RepID=A0A2G4SHG8_RHIZD|nr:uncharacterized protein RHIMIDRAFT_295401 [Rhizopus microsporus ATCC 52813]PHZ08227.1 hypothetical protein RHIMIDRAFT_295401 [Rhizopus microsporus ATCC 52813]
MNTSYCSSKSFFFSERKHKEKFEEGDRTRMQLIIFGDGMKNKHHDKFKGLRCGVYDKLYKQLQRRERLEELLLLDINEYNTSKTCNSCLESNLQNLRRGSGEDECKIQVLICKRCNIFWNRNVMAAKNMFTIAESIWNGNGRPNVFQRQSATSSVVAASHSGGALT